MHRYNKLLFIFCLILPALVFISCSDSTLEKTNRAHNSKSATVWYRQAVVSLGAEISIESPSLGFAISRGKGTTEKGIAYKFTNGEWLPIQYFDYSDFPRITRYNHNTIWILKHLVQSGNYKPILIELKDGDSTVIPLPLKMWDKNDFIMYRDIAVSEDGTAFMVGQKGSILFYDSKKWIDFPSPLSASDSSNVFKNDLHSIYYANGIGWIVGRDGLILNLVGGKWQQVDSPTDEHLNCVKFYDKENGFAIGEKGTVLKFSSGKWVPLNSGVRLSLKDIEVVAPDEFYVVGARSLLLHYKNGSWTANNDIKNYEDDFTGISTVANDSSRYYWVIGDRGIYTNFQNLGFSFTDVTTSLGLPPDFKAAIVGDVNNDAYPDIYLTTVNSPSQFFMNQGGKRFIQRQKPMGDKISVPWTQTAIFGDVDSDGNLDLFELSDDKNFLMLRGDGKGNFEDITDFSDIRLTEIDPTTPISARFVNFRKERGVDLYISNFNGEDNLLFGNPVGRFSNTLYADDKLVIPKELGRESSGAVFSDFNNDGTTDVLIPYRIQKGKSQFDLFYTKEIKGSLTFEKSEQPAFYFKQSTPIESVVAADINADGFMDIVGYNRVRKSLLFLINNENGIFSVDSSLLPGNILLNSTNPSNGALCIVDINNDGLKDIFVGSHLLLNKGSVFVDVSEQSGLFSEGAYSYLDYDNDGDYDVLVGNSFGTHDAKAKSFLYRNNLNPNPINKLTIRYGFYEEIIGLRIFSNSKANNRFTNKTILYDVGLGNNSQTQNQLNNINLPVTGENGYSLSYGRGNSVIEVNNGNIYTNPIIIRANSRWHVIDDLYVRFIRFIYLVSPYAEFSKFLFLLIILIISYSYLKKVWKAQHQIFNVLTIGLYFLTYAVLTFFLYDIKSVLPHTIPPALFLGTISIHISIVINDVKKRNRNRIGNYEIIEVVGQGAMGVVHKAIDANDGKTVALKILKKELFDEPENRKRFISEGRILTLLDNPHIVKVYEAIDSREYSYFAMQYVEGNNLSQLIKAKGKFSQEEAVKAAKEIGIALVEIHSKEILHRDIKSHNIMLSENNYLLMDFGLSRSTLLGSQTSTGAIIGTLGYSAPEQITNSTLDERTDLFGLGVVLYEMVTGTMPFKGNNEMALLHSLFNVEPIAPNILNTSLSVDFSDVILTCLHKNPENRFGTSKEFLQRIEEISVTSFTEKKEYND